MTEHNIACFRVGAADPKAKKKQKQKKEQATKLMLKGELEKI